ncbi:cytochrome [Mangrovactinospora gilvigrisea]|uniref:Cytochrome n=1 Tax=Mangrovactinospora gilvigrisea TaxID=1428644 RepID=A0A1J7BJ42_9ACTN|nr:cytochrome P450 [Mangrovactinospora gilvigrisea]OIV38695.1 cytochrome [Mangrovactinospora gilvigrisea]
MTTMWQGTAARISSWAGRKYLARVQRKGFNLARLPERALVTLRRDGLDPVPELGALRDREPVSKLPLPFVGGAWLVTGHAEAKRVLVDSKSFSNDFTNLVGSAGITEAQTPGGLGFADPPDHTRLRRLLTPEFTMRRLARLTPRIHAIVEERLDALAAEAEHTGRPVDLVQDFALPIPSLVICELLGVPYAEREEFQRLSAARFDLAGGATASFGAVTESLDYFRGIVKQQRTEPGDGLLGQLIRDHGDQIGDDELAGLADGVLTGGFETTASMLALGALLLLRDPALPERLAADEAFADRFVEEALRHLTVVQTAFPRFAREDVEVGGVRIAQGDIVVCSLSAADRDPALGPRMDEFDPERPAAAGHLAFGHGIHRCVGAELARMELRAAYPALARRFPRMRIAVPAEELRFRKLSIVYGLDELPVRLGS